MYATASAHNLGLLEELGADHPIDYHTTPPGKFAPEVDAVIDSRGGETAVATVSGMRPHSAHVSIVGFSAADVDRPDVRMERMLVEPRAGELADLVASLASDRLRVVVDSVTPLAEIVSALTALHAGHTVGKRVVAVADA